MEEFSDFGNYVKANSGSGRNTAKTLNTVTLTNPSYEAFQIPFGENAQKRDLLVQDVLLNEKNFINYWKSREKHRDPKVLAHNIQYGKISDLDNDGFDEFVAYYNDGNKDNVLGYNQYVVGPPVSSQKKVKANYYQQSSKDRQKQSYADYMAAHPEMLTGWMSDEAIQKYKDSLEKKLITKVKNFFKGIPAYDSATPAQKTKVANIFIQIVAEAMIDNDANRAQASVVKGLKGFIEAKKDFIENKILKDTKVKSDKTTIFNLIVSGNGAQVEAYIETLADTNGRILSASDVLELFNYATQTKYMRSLATAQEYNAEANKAGYDAWMNSAYGAVNPLSSNLGTLSK